LSKDGKVNLLIYCYGVDIIMTQVVIEKGGCNNTTFITLKSKWSSELLIPYSF